MKIGTTVRAESSKYLDLLTYHVSNQYMPRINSSLWFFPCPCPSFCPCPWPFVFGFALALILFLFLPLFLSACKFHFHFLFIAAILWVIDMMLWKPCFISDFEKPHNFCPLIFLPSWLLGAWLESIWFYKCFCFM